MTKDDHELLLKDLCARLPYYTKLWSPVPDNNNWAVLTPVVIGNLMNADLSLPQVKPYLRPLSSMTEEEKKELLSLIDSETKEVIEQIKSGDCGVMEGKYHFNSLKELDWLYAKQFDFRGLIPKGLAIEVTKENNPY